MIKYYMMKERNINNFEADHVGGKYISNEENIALVHGLLINIE